jgi:hypothetical protein
LEGGVKKKKKKQNGVKKRRTENGVGQVWTVYVTGPLSGFMENSIRNGGKMGLYIDTYYGEE